MHDLKQRRAEKPMSNYSMNIRGSIGLEDYSNIFDYLKIIDKDDNFIIKINEMSKKDIDVISSMLQNNKSNDSPD